jgi:hypothetical protein
MSALKLYNQKFFLKLYGVRRSLCTAKRRVLEYPEEYPYPDEMEYDVQYAPYQANLKVCYHERLSLVTIYGYVVLPGELRGGYHDMYWRLQEALPDRFYF